MTKRLISIMLVCLLVFALATPVYTAEKAEAVTIRLAKTEGAGVVVTTNAGKTVKTSDKMRLFTGYQVKTDKSSFAFLSLDDTKAVKLDNNTHVEIKKSGQKNEVYVSTGQLFFNVSEKLETTETLNVHTSNASMGIRGTSGMVAFKTTYNPDGTLSASQTVIQIYDGSVTVNIIHPQTGKTEPLSIDASQKLTIDDSAQSGVGKVEITPLTVADIPSFAANEILNDDALVERIKNDTDITAENIKESLPETLAAEAAEATLRDNQIADALKAIESLTLPTTTTTESVTNPETGGSTGGITPSPTTITLTGALTENSFIGAFASTNNVIMDSGSNVTLASGFTLAAQKTLTVQSGATLTANNTLTIAGTLNNNGTVTGTGSLTALNQSSFVNDGTVTISGGINNYGHVANRSARSIAVITMHNAARLENLGTTTNVTVGGDATDVSIVNSSTIDYISLENNGVISSLDNSGGTITAITGANGAKITFTGDNVGTILDGVFYNEPNSVEALNTPETDVVYSFINGKWAGPAPSTYTVAFNPQDDAISSSYLTVDAGQTVLNMPADPERAGYIFLGWNTQADGNGTPFTEQTVVNSNMYVYAIWEIMTATTAATFDDIQSAITNMIGDEMEITVTADISMTSTLTIPADKSVTLLSDTQMRTLQRSASGFMGNMFEIDGILELSDITLDGNSANITAHNPLVTVSSIGTLNINAGVTLQNNNSDDGNGGGGVYNNGTLYMSGGDIINNSSAGTGGGVFNNTSATVDMIGGSISNNTSIDGGGVRNYGLFNMSADAIISYNTASMYGGGGLVNSGTFVLSGGSIIYNTAASNGGGVYNSGTFGLSGGTITNNTATSSGGGIYCVGGTTTMTSGSISNNTANGNFGGGVYVGSWFRMSGGTISGNTAFSNGTGVYNLTGQFEMSDDAVVSDTNDVYLVSEYVPVIVSGALNSSGSVAKLTLPTYNPGTVCVTFAIGLMPDPTLFTLTSGSLSVNSQNLEIGNIAN